jgi:hypothetical protein
MVEPDLSHLPNPDPTHIVIVQTSVSDPDPDPGRPKRSLKKEKKARNFTFGRAFSVAKSALEVYDLCNFLTANLF